MTVGRPRILLAYNTSWYVWNFRVPLIRALQERGYEVIVCAPRDEYSERLAAAGIAWREIRMAAHGTNPLQELRTLCELFRAFRGLRPRVILLYTVKPNLYGSLAARVLRISVVANVTGLGAAFERRGVLQAVVRLLYRTAFARVERVFFQNPDDQRSFLDSGLVRREQADLLPGSGVDLDRFAPQPRGEGAFTFLFVGRLLRPKGVEDLVAAARRVAERRRGVRVILLGKRDDRDPDAADPVLLRDAEEKGIVEMPGNVDDVRPFLAQADCVVLPSYYREGTPRSLLEAAAMGRPIIAADTPGTREPVRDGINGFLCRPHDPEHLASKMLAMAELPAEERARMGEASRQLAEERYSERIVIGKYLEAVDRLAGSAR